MLLTEQQKRVAKVLSNMLEMVDNDYEYADMFTEMLEPALTELHSQDAFGTEGQNDPRGDFRVDQWSMDRVQGIDG